MSDQAIAVTGIVLWLIAAALILLLLWFLVSAIAKPKDRRK